MYKYPLSVITGKYDSIDIHFRLLVADVRVPSDEYFVPQLLLPFWLPSGPQPSNENTKKIFSAGLKKTCPACPLGKQLSSFSYLGPLRSHRS